MIFCNIFILLCRLLLGIVIFLENFSNGANYARDIFFILEVMILCNNISMALINKEQIKLNDNITKFPLCLLNFKLIDFCIPFNTELFLFFSVIIEALKLFRYIKIRTTKLHLIWYLLPFVTIDYFQTSLYFLKQKMT